MNESDIKQADLKKLLEEALARLEKSEVEKHECTCCKVHPRYDIPIGGREPFPFPRTFGPGC